MEPRSSHEVTRLLRAWSAAEESALEELVPLVYQELRRMAHRHLVQERPGHMLQTAALVREAYLRLSGIRQIDWQDRAHFFVPSRRN